MKAADEGAYQWVVVTLGSQVLGHSERLELDDQHLVMPVCQQMELLAPRCFVVQAHITNMERKDFVLGQPRQVLAHVEAGLDDLVEAAAEQCVGGRAQPLHDVFTHLQDLQMLEIEHQDKPVRLNATRHLNRLLSATFDRLGKCSVGSHRRKRSCHLGPCMPHGSGAGWW